jgi:glycine cleavage system regulatory protein
MRPPFIAIATVVHAEPPGAVDMIKAALANAGACIVSAQRHGNQALVFGFEIDARNLHMLETQLERVARLLDPSVERMRESAHTLAPEAEVHGSLHVTLVHDAPDERVELPKVPG